MSIKELLDKIDGYRAVISAKRPLTAEEIRELDGYYRIGTTYTSNALEGNSLTLSETKVLLEDGLTAGGKPVRDCYEATGHAEAYDFMLEVARSGELCFTEDIIKRLHFLFYRSIDSVKAGVYRQHQIFITGTEFLPPTVADIPDRMRVFIQQLNEQKTFMHSVLFAAFAHRRLVDIHPFDDGNGRTARLLMNLILMNGGYCIISIPPILWHEYITALQAAQRSENPSDTLFCQLICQCEIEAQKDYCRLFRIPLKTGPEPM